MMVCVGMEYVVSFSSQDNNFKVNNLINNTDYKKWLTNPSDRSGQCQITLQLKRPVVISYIDLGTIWCATVQIQVGRSEWPQDREFLSFVPTSSVMTPQECRTESSFIKTRMFGPADFTSDIVKQKWDRVRIIGRQPFRRNVQMGLSFVHIKIPDNGGSSSEKVNTPKSVKSIQKHFFGKLSSSDGKTTELKSKLMKISGSGEDGIEQEHCLNRNAKLVLAATGSVDRFSVPPPITSPEGRSKFYSMRIAQQTSPKLEEEALSFLNSIEFKKEDLDKITIADIRHKFEKRIKRKLTSEEKKTFMKLCSDYICEIFMTTVNLNTKCPSSCNGDPFVEKDVNSMNRKHDSSSAHESPRTAGPAHESPKMRQSSFASKCFTKQAMNSLTTPSTEDHWLNTSTHASNGKRKRQSDGTQMGERLNRGAKRQLLEEEERRWLGMEGMKTGRVSTAVSPRTRLGMEGMKTGRVSTAVSPRTRLGMETGRVSTAVSPRTWLGMEGVETGKVSTAVSPREGTSEKKPVKKRTNKAKLPTADTPTGSRGVAQTENYSRNGSLCGGRNEYEEYSLDSPTSFVECPICGDMFPQESIEVHAAVCLDMSSAAY